MSDLSKKRVITAALCGSWPTKDMNPAVPYTPEEIAEEAYACWKAGAAIVHVHVRNADGSPSTDFGLYKETVDRIRAHKDCDVCINITSSGSVDFGDEERIYPLQQLLPELASYDAGTLNWQHRTVFMNPPSFLEKLGYALQESNIKPEIEIFDAGMVYNTIYYMKKGVLKAPCHYQIVLGCAGGMTSTVENLVYLKNILPEGSTWAACGISSEEHPAGGVHMGGLRDLVGAPAHHDGDDRHGRPSAGGAGGQPVHVPRGAGQVQRPAGGAGGEAAGDQRAGARHPRRGP